jgi:hypothetical protein
MQCTHTHTHKSAEQPRDILSKCSDIYARNQEMLRKDEENKNTEKGFMCLHSRGLYSSCCRLYIYYSTVGYIICEQSLVWCYTVWQAQYKRNARSNMHTTCMLRYLHCYIYVCMYGVRHSVCQLRWIDTSLVNICRAERAGILLLIWVCFQWYCDYS